MLTKTVPLIVAVLAIGYIAASRIADKQGAEAASAAFADDHIEPQPARPASLARDCSASTTASPFDRVQPGCKSEADMRPPTANDEAGLMHRLEELTQRGDPQAQFELAMQLQRRAQRAGRQMNEADVAESQELQRAVALIAEARAAGNIDAKRFGDALGNHERLLHTGR